MQSGLPKSSEVEEDCEDDDELHIVGLLEQLIENCPYVDVCSQSEYGVDCDYLGDKESCKFYWKNLEVEKKLWNWYQPEFDYEKLK